MTTTADGGAVRKSRASSTGAAARGPARTAAAEQLSRADRVARGKDARAVAPLESHAEFSPRADAGVPVHVLPGAALPMAADLAGHARVGAAGAAVRDAHLSNFGAFASPERNLVFDVNDFDETLPGPFEWDVKRLAVSLAVAGRDNGYPASAVRKSVAQVDGGGAKKLKAALADAQAGMGG